MVCSRGESLTHRTNQMKLLNAIAAAAVIGTSFIAANPVEARWVYLATNGNGDKIHIKDVSCGGPICEFDFTAGSTKYNTGMQINCNSWQRRYRNVSDTSKEWFDWETMGPDSWANTAAQRVCR